MGDRAGKQWTWEGYSKCKSEHVGGVYSTILLDDFIYPQTV